MGDKLSQEEVNERIVKAQRTPAKERTEYQWTLLAYAFPAGCPSCAYTVALLNRERPTDGRS